MKFLKIMSGLMLALAGMIMFTSVVLADPAGNVSNLTANPSDTSMVLTWTPASGSTGTVILYRTDTYSANWTDGTVAYTGNKTQCTVSPLIPGATYYFSAWGYDGVGYSTTPAHCVMNTLPVSLPSGGEETHTGVIPVPTVPATANATATISGFHFEPFTSIISFFITDNTSSPGGLGMPENNAWEVLAVGGIVLGGLGTYIKMKNFFVAYFVVFLLSLACIGLHLVQWYLAPVEIVIGLGVWALERYFQ